MDKDERPFEACWWERLTEGKLGLVLMGGAMLSKSLIQFLLKSRAMLPTCYFSSVQFSSVHSLSRVQLFAIPWTAARQASPSITSPRVNTDSRPLSQWCHPAISSFVIPFCSCPKSLPASESFPMSQLFTRSGQSTGVSALASFLPKKSQGWSPSEWTG